MGFGLKKSYRFGPLRLNVSKSNMGLSAKIGPFSQSINSSGRGRSTVSSNGVFYRKYETIKKKDIDNETK